MDRVIAPTRLRFEADPTARAGGVSAEARPRRRQRQPGDRPPDPGGSDRARPMPTARVCRACHLSDIRSAC